MTDFKKSSFLKSSNALRLTWDADSMDSRAEKKIIKAESDKAAAVMRAAFHSSEKKYDFWTAWEGAMTFIS